jgi:malonyl-CoA reductase/3-hydroxypropionate dehydrogenase (NADP+)
MLPVGDSADPEAGRQIVAETLERFGRLDVLINNAGGAGPKQTLQKIPFSAAEAKRKRRRRDHVRGRHEPARRALEHVARRRAAPVEGRRIVNVSTIFSRTPYFGRIPYVVPKSGLNALQGLARELGGGDRGIRVNTVFPGPIESERIDTVFAAMDELQDLARRQHRRAVQA